MAKYFVRAVQRDGHDGTWRADRKWPSATPTEIEVVDGPDPRIAVPVAPGQKPRTMADPHRVSHEVFALLTADPRLAIVSADLVDVAAANAEAHATRDELAKLRDKLAIAEASAAEADQKITRLSNELMAARAEVSDLREKLRPPKK